MDHLFGQARNLEVTHRLLLLSLMPDVTNFYLLNMQTLPISFHLTCCNPNPCHPAPRLTHTVATVS